MSSDRATYYLHFLQRKLVRFDMTGGSDCLQRLSLEMLAISAECSFGALACSPGRLKRLDCSAESIRQKRSWDSFVRFMTYDEIYILPLSVCQSMHMYLRDFAARSSEKHACFRVVAVL